MSAHTSWVVFLKKVDLVVEIRNSSIPTDFLPNPRKEGICQDRLYYDISTCSVPHVNLVVVLKRATELTKITY